jgi:arsenical pump membrane protein
MAAFGGVFVMFSLGIVTPAHWVQATHNLWTPFVAIASIMVITDVARRAGLLEWWARSIDVRASSTARLFLLVFALGVATSTAFNNDAAILLLTPLILALTRRRFPDRPEMALPFAFAVFMSAGVAALPVSNPMNMVVAEFMGISFNEYARHMIPIAVAGWFVGFVVLRRIFADQLTTPIAAAKASNSRATTMQRLMIVLLACVLASYPLFGSVGGPVWVVAALGAMFSLLLARHHLGISPLRLVREGVSWETLAFLCAVLIMALGLKEVGLVDRLASLYSQSGLPVVGVTSAVGSAILNNHPMSYLNMMALDVSSSPNDLRVFAALVGGDLGPRLLPMGSLAGLLWLDILQRHGIDLSVRRFLAVGLLVATPTIAVSLAILSLG